MILHRYTDQASAFSDALVKLKTAFKDGFEVSTYLKTCVM